jgi:cytoskeletal protein CcmA (bactofilin family)
VFKKRKPRPAIEATPLSSLIAEDVEITGDVRFARGIRIDGRLKGDLLGRPTEGQAGALLVLSDKGRIEGTVTCRDAVVNGTVIGDLRIENFLELQSNARVIGSVRYGQLQMEVGAVVRGQVCSADDTPEAPQAPVHDNVVELARDVALAK